MCLRACRARAMLQLNPYILYPLGGVYPSPHPSPGPRLAQLSAPHTGQALFLGAVWHLKYRLNSHVWLSFVLFCRVKASNWLWDAFLEFVRHVLNICRIFKQFWYINPRLVHIDLACVSEKVKTWKPKNNRALKNLLVPIKNKLSLTSDKPQVGLKIEEFSSALILVWCFYLKIVFSLGFSSWKLVLTYPESLD